MDTEVLIVGAGPIGLTLAGLLRAQDIDVMVLESHPGLSRHPKARGISARSMETFRKLGLEDQIRAEGLPDEHVRFFRADTLTSPDFALSDPPSTQARGNTPAPGVLCSQDRLEPVLLENARARGARVEFGHRVTEVHDAHDGVAVAVDGHEVRRAPFVVGCDGARSTVRRSAGIALSGQKDLARFLSVRFRAPLGDAVRDRTAASYFLTGGKGGFLAIDNDQYWIYQYPVPDGVDPSPLREDITSLIGLVRAAAGVPDLDVEILDTMLWRMDARIADVYHRGRTLLAGDAAHQTPPTGGHGMNVGIGDADTLAWMLADVVRGRAAATLLDRYDKERRPVGAAVIGISSDNAARRYAIDDELLLGTTYDAATPVPNEPYQPSGTPGRRLPHVALLGDPAVTSTIDLIGTGLAIFVLEDDQTWRNAATASGITLISMTTAERRLATPGEFAERCGVVPGGALLVRPDGHIAARFTPTQTADLAGAIAALRS